MTPFIQNVQTGKCIETESRHVVARNVGRDTWGVANRYEASLEGGGNVVKLDSKDNKTH